MRALRAARRVGPSRRRCGAAAALALALYASLSAAACGAVRPHARTAAGTAVAHGTAAVAGAPAAPPGQGACAATVAATLGSVAGRIYHEAASGGDVEQAVARVRGSAALSRAAAAGDGAAAAAALRGLLAGQIARIEVLRGGRVLASAGSGTAIAPVRGSLPGGGASFVLSVQPVQTYVRVAAQVTGAQVVLMSGTRRLAGTIAVPAATALPASGPVTLGGRQYQTATVSGSTFPAGPLQVVLLVPSAGLSCAGSPAEIAAAVLGGVGERIYQEELHSSQVAATVSRMEDTAAFRAAVAARSPAATRAAIIGFFRAHIHVVRVRVTVGGRLLVDVGGPYALAPVTGTVRSGGRVVGRFVTAIQDDAGYLKLAHLFTGAQVLMREGSRQIMGTLSPGPASVPDRGAVRYGGHSYQAYSFAATAFPSGPLRISLLF